MPDGRLAGFPTHWTVRGSGERKALLIHCSLASQAAWKGIAAILDPLLQMTAFDLPGHGQSGDWDRRGDIHTVATAIAADLIGAPCDLIGHSYGATVALRLALEQPEKIRTLTLIEPVLLASVRDQEIYASHHAEFAPFVAALDSGDMRGAARAFTAIWGDNEPWDSVPEAQRVYLEGRINLIPESASTINDDAPGVLTPGRLEQLNVPVLLIEGQQSPAIIAAVQSALASRLPCVRRVVIPGVGHMAPLTHPAPIAEAIAGFLAVAGQVPATARN